MNWEAEFLSVMDESSRSLDYHNEAGANEQTLKLWYQAGRSWSDISASTMFEDSGKLMCGIVLMSIYVQVLLSRFNWVEWRVRLL